MEYGVHWCQWAGLVLGLLGVVLIVSSRIEAGFGLLGLPAAFAALFGITSGTLYQKRFCPSFDYRSGAVIQFVPAALITGFALLFFEDFHVEWTARFLFALGWLTVVVAGVYLARTSSAKGE